MCLCFFPLGPVCPLTGSICPHDEPVFSPTGSVCPPTEAMCLPNKAVCSPIEAMCPPTGVGRVNFCQKHSNIPVEIFNCVSGCTHQPQKFQHDR